MFSSVRDRAKEEGCRIYGRVVPRLRADIPLGRPAW